MPEEKTTTLVGPEYAERSLSDWKTGRTPCKNYDSLSSQTDLPSSTTTTNSTEQKEESDPF